MVQVRQRGQHAADPRAQLGGLVRVDDREVARPAMPHTCDGRQVAVAEVPGEPPTTQVGGHRDLGTEQRRVGPVHLDPLGVQVFLYRVGMHILGVGEDEHRPPGQLALSLVGGSCRVSCRYHCPSSPSNARIWP
jgi:hypothetical protein